MCIFGAFLFYTYVWSLQTAYRNISTASSQNLMYHSKAD